jgi:hypothetical protein
MTKLGVNKWKEHELMASASGNRVLKRYEYLDLREELRGGER